MQVYLAIAAFLVSIHWKKSEVKTFFSVPFVNSIELSKKKGRVDTTETFNVAFPLTGWAKNALNTIRGNGMLDLLRHPVYGKTAADFYFIEGEARKEAKNIPDRLFILEAIWRLFLYFFLSLTQFQRVL